MKERLHGQIARWFPCSVRFTDLTDSVFSPQPCAQQAPTASTDALAMVGRSGYDRQWQAINYNVDINPRGLVLPEICFSHHPLLSLALGWFQRAWEHSPSPTGTHLCPNSNLISQIFSCSEKIMATLAWAPTTSLHRSDFLYYYLLFLYCDPKGEVSPILTNATAPSGALFCVSAETLLHWFSSPRLKEKRDNSCS